MSGTPSTRDGAGVPAVDTVFLDVGGVLLLPHHEIVLECLESVGHEIDADLLDHAHYHGSAALAEWPARSREGTHADHAIYQAFNAAYARALGITDEIVDEVVEVLFGAFARIDMWTRPAPGAVEGLEALTATGAKLCIVSNASGQVEGDLRRLGVCQVGPGGGVEVDAVIDSAVVGVAKPDPAIFEIALDRVGSSPERSIHVGDIVGADVAGARAAGIRPVHFDPYGMCHHRDDHDHVAALTEVAELVAP